MFRLRVLMRTPLRGGSGEGGSSGEECKQAPGTWSPQPIGENAGLSRKPRTHASWGFSSFWL